MHEIEFADPLLELEWKIARRADELSVRAAHDKETDLACWLQAERDICGEPASLGAAAPESASLA